MDEQEPRADAYCPSCGTEVSPEDGYCPNCGQRLASQEDPAEQPPPERAPEPAPQRPGPVALETHSSWALAISGVVLLVLGLLYSVVDFLPNPFPSLVGVLLVLLGVWLLAEAFRAYRAQEVHNPWAIAIGSVVLLVLGLLHFMLGFVTDPITLTIGVVLFVLGVWLLAEALRARIGTPST